MTLPDYLCAEPVGRNKLSSEVLRAHRRARVLAAATEVFATRSYRATTVDDLAAAAHIGIGTFYALFDGKEDCFLRAYDRIIDAASQRIAAAIPTAAAWPERAGAALEALLGWIAAEPPAVRIVLVEAQTAGPAAIARYEATLQRLLSPLREGRTYSQAAAEPPAALSTRRSPASPGSSTSACWTKRPMRSRRCCPI